MSQPQPDLGSKTSSSTVTQIPTITRKPTTQQITLVDHTRPGDPVIQNPGDLQDEDDSTPLSASLSRRWTRQSLQGRMASRRYRHYRHDRFIGPEDPDNPSPEDASDSMDLGRMQRGKNRVRGLLKTRKQMQLALEEDAVIDVLYENQRGWWFFGVPHFSSKTLLNFDPRPWLNGHRKPSPVNITNAQVPDPNWEWAWNSWYVDMSRDVDEEGWEYSFWFSEGTSWHGTHPWGHSWVRRRRWLRKRVRKQPQRGPTQPGHNFTSEYFTIHPPRAMSRISSSLLDSQNISRQNLRSTENYLQDPSDVRDIGTLLAALKRAAIDREKIVLVRNFVNNGSEELHYLGEYMETIMALCVFQNSRRYILTILNDKLDSLHQSVHDHDAHGEEVSVQDQDKIENLHNAIKAADDQVKRLEYWSDVRNMTRNGHTASATDDSNGWDNYQWRGLDNSGPEADMGTAAKEKGKSVYQVQKESESQLRPKDSAFAFEQSPKKKNTTIGHLAETSEEAVYTTAEDEPGSKGKGRAE